jgi:hypothetical protein
MTSKGEGPGLWHVKASNGVQDVDNGANFNRFRITDNDTFLVPQTQARIVCASKLAENGLPLVMSKLGRGKHALVRENSGQIIPCIRVEDTLVLN